jgi:hypothetical protein
MKKLFVVCALAMAVTMASQQTASAWSECKFSVGLNFGWVGGGNRILWGAYRSAPYPGGQDLGPLMPGYAAAANNGQYFGWPPAGAVGPGPIVGPGYVAPAPSPVAPVTPVAPPVPPHVNNGVQQTYYGYYDNGYQPTSYYPGAYYQAPSYWYGR